jgi:TrmH family RNA methyltransferase
MQGGIVNNVTHLTSTQNARVKDLIHLRERRARDKEGLFLIEGYRELMRANDAKWPITEVFFCRELFLGDNEPTLLSNLQTRGAKLFSCSEPVFRKMSYRDRPDGLIAIAKQQHPTLATLADKLKKSSPLFVVAESIEKPGNLGTILRTADATATDALIVCDRCTDIFNPNVVRASVGTLFTVPVVEAGGEETLQWLKQNNVAILAATPAATEEYTDVDMQGPLAIVVGTEQLGLTSMWMANADIQVRIPMLGIADSLNVAMATALMLYEALRQRKQK